MTISPSLRDLAICVALTSSLSFGQTALSASAARASQRAGTKLVDVYYDVNGGTPPYTVTLEGSSDGGATWTLPVTTVSGNVGIGVVAGTNRKVTWNAGADWAGQISDTVRFRVNVADSATSPVPDGFALIPAGTFLMGDQKEDYALIGGDQSDSNEHPVHTVFVSAFYMAKHETTKELWNSVREWGLVNGYTDLRVGNAKGLNHPVHTVSWHDAVKWCNARSQKEGFTPCYTIAGGVFMTGTHPGVVCNFSANGYRLPTEAEWEKSARGGLLGKRFPWGDTISHIQANYVSEEDELQPYDVSPTRGSHPLWSKDKSAVDHSSPVGSFPPNEYGLHDMAGNIWEMCWDWNARYSSLSQADPRGPASGEYRIIRGGVNNYVAYYCRVSARAIADDNYSYEGVGFRIVRSPVPKKQ